MPDDAAERADLERAERKRQEDRARVRVRAELERGDIPVEVLSNNTIEARGHFITTVILIERSLRGEHGRVRVFVDGEACTGFGFEVEG